MSHYICNMKREWGREPASSNTEVLLSLLYILLLAFYTFRPSFHK